MVHMAARVPAWRKLGLVLYNEDQSAPTLPHSRTSPSQGHHVPTHDAQFKPTVHEKPSRLSNRQDEQGLPFSASHIVEKGTAAFNAGKMNGAAFVSPRGDPNYRKKKGKPNQPKREARNGAETSSSLTQPTPSSPDKSTSMNGPLTLLASTEIDYADLPAPATPHKLSKISKSRHGNSLDSQDCRKSVAFTPDTKKSDGNNGQTIFKKRTEPDSEASESVASPSITPIESSPASVKSSSTGVKKKKDPTIYIAYLTQYFTNRHNWKFNKARQNDVIENATNVFRIPDEHSEALVEYVSGLQGAGAISRLTEKCKALLKEMDDVEARKEAQEEALQERILRERKRRKIEGDMESLRDHPYGDGYIRRLQRNRAEALLIALGCTVPVLPSNVPTNGINPMTQHLAPSMRDSKKRKRRGKASDSSSSDSSSEEESSSSESESEDSESDSDSQQSDSSRSVGSDDSSLDEESHSESSESNESTSESTSDDDSD